MINKGREKHGIFVKFDRSNIVIGKCGFCIGLDLGNCNCMIWWLRL